MKLHEFHARVRLPVPAAQAFAWHERPGAVERMMPPWEHAEVVRREGTIRDGDRIVLALGTRPLRMQLEHVHRGYIAGRRFCDDQVKGPFARFSHRHEVTPNGAHASFLDDHVEYALPFGIVGRVASGPVRARLARGFAYRHAVLANDLARHARVAASGPLRIAITGGSGVIGTALCAFLTSGGHEVVRLVRRAPGAGEHAWDPARGSLDPHAFDGVDAVIHLAGEPVGDGRWTDARKHRILHSRVAGTALLARTLAGLARPPTVLLSASAIGFYGSTGTSAVDETAQAGADFLADVCQQWEAATAPAADAGIRVATLRLGVVLTPGGGALARLLPAFRFGLGGPIGDGHQWMSWITLDDAVYAIHHALFSDALAGPVNLVAPRAVTNGELATTLARVLVRPARVRVPALAVELALGELGRIVALGGIEVWPRRLLASGFAFGFPELEHGLRHVLGARR